MVELDDVIFESENPLETFICSWFFRIILFGIALIIIYLGLIHMGQLTLTIPKNATQFESLGMLIIKAYDEGWKYIGENLANIITQRFSKKPSDFQIFLITIIPRKIYEFILAYSILRPIFTFEYWSTVAKYLTIILALVGVIFIFGILMGYIYIMK